MYVLWNPPSNGRFKSIKFNFLMRFQPQFSTHTGLLDYFGFLTYIHNIHTSSRYLPIRTASYHHLIYRIWEIFTYFTNLNSYMFFFEKIIYVYIYNYIYKYINLIIIIITIIIVYYYIS